MNSKIPGLILLGFLLFFPLEISGASGIHLHINIPALNLKVMEEEQLLGEYPVAIGTQQWPTPHGTFRVKEIVENPTWYPRDRAGIVPPGEDNPLGPYWIGLDKPGYGIHGTNEPGTIGRAVTQGCLRLHNADLEEVVPLIEKNSAVIIDYQIWEAEVSSLGLRVFSHPDIYGKKTPVELREILKRQGISTEVIPAGTRRRIVAPYSGEQLFPLQIEIKQGENFLGTGIFFYGEVWISHVTGKKIFGKDTNWEEWYKKEGQGMATMLPLSALEELNGRYRWEWKPERLELALEN